MRGILSAVLCGAALLSSAPSWGQPVAADPVAAAFAEVMANPADPDAALRYARLLAAEGKVRPAIAALERILRLNPRLDNIRLELASLYLAAGSPEVATLYAEQALASPAIPADVTARARQLLTTAEKAASPSLLTGSAFFGTRYDTNATQASSLATVLLPGAVVPVTPAVRARGSGSVVGGAQLNHRYDLGLQREGAWETNGSGFGQVFWSVPSDFNFVSTYIDTGPRIGIGDIGPVAWAMRPFVSGAFLAYGANPFSLQTGGGLSSYFKLPPRWTLELTGIGRFSNYYNSDFRPLMSGYTGPEWGVFAAPTYAFDARTAVTGTVFYYSADARQPYYARSGPGATAALATDFTIGNYTVGTAVRGGVRHVSYDAPDPFINPVQSRRDWLFEAGGSLIFPLSETVAAIAQYGFTRLNSNYAIYSFGNHAATVGLRVTF
jgi:hypothetical protein